MVLCVVLAVGPLPPYVHVNAKGRSKRGRPGTEATSDHARALYHLQYGSGKTLGASSGADHPTYVYPSTLKAVIRARYPDIVKDWMDPTGPHLENVFRVNGYLVV